MFQGISIQFRSRFTRDRNEIFYKKIHNSNNLSIELSGRYYEIELSFSLIINQNSNTFGAGVQYIFYGRDITDYRVRIKIQEMKTNNMTGLLERDKYVKSSLKKYDLNNDLLTLVSKLRPYIISQLEKEESYSGQDIIVSFDDFNDFTTIEKPENYTVEQINEFMNSIEDINLVNLSSTVLLFKSLNNFKDELTSVLQGTEHEISAVFKKYETVVSLVLFGMNSKLTFEYEIDTENYNQVIPDVHVNNEGNQTINLIELKRADAQMFNDTPYRNNTLKIKPEFFNAIHQTNIQRSLLALSGSFYQDTIPKSILIFGHLGNERERLSVNGEILLQNLNTLRYNNKDVLIITYDELISKIEALINNNL